jgi:DNA-binding transcriptional ArsR family regulator
MSRRDAGAARLVRAAPVFAALGDETRLALVARLSDGEPRSIARLTEGSAMTRQAVTKHLRVLAGAGLVRDARRGRERVWALDAAELARARGTLEALSRRWDDALARLRLLVEG